MLEDIWSWFLAGAGVAVGSCSWDVQLVVVLDALHQQLMSGRQRHFGAP